LQSLPLKTAVFSWCIG